MIDGKYTTAKRIFAFVSGVGMAFCSIYLSKRGVGFSDELWWIGLVVALALFGAELMFNSSFDELTWTGLALGMGAYLYSIGTNIGGFYFYRGIPGNLWTNFDLTNFAGGIFMDIYPELAIAWAFKESKVGDWLGNIIRVWNDPDALTQSDTVSKPISKEIMEKLPKKQLNLEIPDSELDRLNAWYDSNQRSANGSKTRR